MKKQPYGVRANQEAETKNDMKKFAIRADKGVAFLSPNGKVWLMQVDDLGVVSVTEVTAV